MAEYHPCEVRGWGWGWGGVRSGGAGWGGVGWGRGWGLGFRVWGCLNISFMDFEPAPRVLEMHAPHPAPQNP